MGIEVIGVIVAGAVVVLLTLYFTSIHYAKKAVKEEIHRYLEEHAREVGENVTDIMGEPLGTDDELLARLKPDGMPEDSIGG